MHRRGKIRVRNTNEQDFPEYKKKEKCLGQTAYGMRKGSEPKDCGGGMDHVWLLAFVSFLQNCGIQESEGARRDICVHT